MGLGEELETLIEFGPSRSRFSTVLGARLRELRQDWGREPAEIRDEIADLDMDHPLLEFLLGLSRWEGDREYEDGAELTLEALNESAEIAQEDGWIRVEKIVLEERIRLRSQLNHADSIPSAVEAAIQFLIDYSGELPIGPTTDLFEVITPHVSSIENPELVDDLLDALDAESTDSIEDNRFSDARTYLRAKLRIPQQTEVIEPEAIRDSIIETYRSEIEFHKEAERHFHRADAAHEAIVECIEWIDEKQRVEWEQEVLDANQASIEQMAEISHEPSEEDAEALTESIEGIIEQFEELKQERDAVFAIKWLITHDIFYPSIEEAREIAEGGISSIIPRRTISREGGSYDPDEAGGDWPAGYGAMVQLTQNIRQSVYYRLQNRELISELDFYILFGHVDALTADNMAYLTDFVTNVFEHRYPEAVHLGMSQLESIIRTLMVEHGKSTYHLDSETGELRPRGLSGLLYQIHDVVDRDWLTYMQYWYADLSGQNIRNQIAHGHFPYSKANWGMAVIQLFDIVHTFLVFEEAFD